VNKRLITASSQDYKVQVSAHSFIAPFLFARNYKTMDINIKINSVYDYLLKEKARFKVCYGGRGAGRTWNFARSLLVRVITTKVPLRILCAREIQKSIKRSTHATLVDQINMLGLRNYFYITDEAVRCNLTKSEFFFEGLFRNTKALKSIEGIDICDVEEAENVSDESWEDLIPTIRKDGSEIWIRFNTQYADDPTYERFISSQPLEPTIVKKVNYDQNPDFPEVLKQEIEDDKARRPWVVANKWYGEPLGKGRKIWQGFDEKFHVKQFPWELVKERGNCYMGCDPAQHYYPACIWMAILPKFESKGYFKYIYNEWPTHDDLGDDFHRVRNTMLYNGTILEMAKQFYVKDGTAEHGLNIRSRYIDTRFAKGSGSSSFFNASTVGIVGEFAKTENGGLIFDCPGEKIIDVQRDAIIKDLQTNVLTPVNAINEPALYIAPWCTNLILSLKNHRLDMNTEQEDSRYKDFSDALRICYAGISDFMYIDPKPKEQENVYEYAGNSDGWMN
jgi:hypothetical protein